MVFPSCSRLPWLKGACCGIVLTLGVANPAKAIQYNFQNVTFSYRAATSGPIVNGSTITGSFEYNGTVASILPGQSIFVNFIDNNPADLTYTSSNSAVDYPATLPAPAPPNSIRFFWPQLNNTSNLFLTLSGPLSTAPNTSINIVSGFFCQFNVASPDCADPRRRFDFTSVSGSVVSVPSPTSAAVVAPLMAVALYRKRFNKLMN